MSQLKCHEVRYLAGLKEWLGLCESVIPKAVKVKKAEPKDHCTRLAGEMAAISLFDADSTPDNALRRLCEGGTR